MISKVALVGDTTSTKCLLADYTRGSSKGFQTLWARC